MSRFNGAHQRHVIGLVALALTLGGCSFNSLVDGERVDYRSNATKINPLEVPPDLAQLNKESRYSTQQRGTVSASAQAAPGMTRTSAPSRTQVAPTALGDFKVERDGDKRWLVVPRPPEQIWSQVANFWQELGFTLVKNDPNTGVMETNWAENRAKLPQDVIRKAIGSVLDSAYSTGEMDQYRTRVERTASGSEIFIRHRAMEEVHTSPLQDNTRWQPRAPDPQMEAEMLSRLLVKLGASEAVARSAVENPQDVSKPPERARIVTGRPGATLEVDDGLDRAWRRVGVALDRSGFTVEDRDRAAGLYFVRYVDPKTAGVEDTTGFFSKLFGGSSDTSGAAVKYQVSLKSEGGKTLVSLLNAQGAPDASENSQRIVGLLVEELR